MSQQPISRRKFFAQTTAGAAALGSSSLVARRAYGANDRLSIGLIGVGDRCQAHLAEIQRLAQKQNVQITAICDVWKVNLARAAEKVKKGFGIEPYQCTRFGDLLARKDVDAVVIATPDYAHTPIMIAALKAGKDVYVEKPMSTDIEEANEALDLARKHNRVVQVGTQYRSDGGYIAAAKALAEGVLGAISRVSASCNFNEPRWNRKFDDCKEADVDWGAYLFNRHKRPFNPSLLRRWHFYHDFTNGLSGLWMAHYSDALHMLTGAKYPSSAVSLGGVYVWKDGREHTDAFHTVMDYPEGFLWDWGMSLTNGSGNFFRVHGSQGTLEVSTGHAEPNSLTLSPEGGRADSKIKTVKIKPEPTQSHMGNWLECLRTRQRPNADIQFGHQHAVATIMAAAALDTGRRQKYDPKRRKMYAG